MPNQPVEYRVGDILSAHDLHAIANPVNTVGVMGKGLARAFATRYPQIMAPYRRACRNASLRPGHPVIHDLGGQNQPRWIVSFPTKDHWRNKSRLEWIDKGLKQMYSLLARQGAQSVGLPALGAGLGGLPWPEVRDLITRHASENTTVRTVVFLREHANR